MTDIAALGLRVDGVDGIDRAKSSLDRLVSAAESMDRAAQAMAEGSRKAAKEVKEVARSSDGASKSVDSLAVTASRAGGVLAGAFSVAAIKNYADAWSDMQSRVGAATKDMAGAAKQMTRLVEIANASYSSLTQTVDAYAGNVSTLQDLGRSAAEAADYTESLNHMLVLTATKGERAVSVQNALSKAMAVGRLGAEGLETILAHGGEVASALAKELGTTVSGLRSLASEGKITSQVIASGIIKPLEDVRSRAAEMPATVSDAFTRINTNTTELIGRFDKLTGASEAVSGVILRFADGLRGLSESEESLNSLLDVATVLAVVLGGRLAGAAATSAASFAAANYQALAYQFTLARMAGVGAVASAGMAAMGGPVGLVVAGLGLAALAWNKYGSSASENADKGVMELLQTSAGIDDMLSRFEKLNKLQQQGVISEKSKELAAATKEAADAVNDLYQAYKPYSGKGPNVMRQFNKEFSEEIAALSKNASLSSDEMASAFSELIDKFVASGRGYESQRESLTAMAQKVVEASGKVNVLTSEVKALTSAQYENAGAPAPTADPLISIVSAALEATKSYKSLSERMQEVRDAGQTAQAALDELKDAGKGGSKEAQQLQSRIDGVNEQLKKMAGSGRSGAGGIKQTENAYTSLSKRISEYVAQLELEAKLGEKASTSQKMQLELDSLLAKSKGKVSAAMLSSMRAGIKNAEAMEATAKAESDLKKAIEDDEKAFQKLSEQRESGLKSLHEYLARLEDEQKAYELSEDAKISLAEATERLTIARIEEHLAMSIRGADSQDAIDALEKELAIRKRILGLIQTKEVNEANAKAQQQIAQDWEKVSQTIGRTLSDYIMGGGKDAAQYLKRLFATLVLEPVINYGVQGMMSGLGMGPGQQTGGGVLGAANSASSLWSAFSGGTSGTLASGVVGLGKLMGSSFMGELGAGIAAGGQLGISGTASLIGSAGGTTGAGMAIGAALPWVAGGLAIASLLGSFDFGSRGANHSGAAASSAGISNDAAALQIFGRASGAWYGDVTKRHSAEMETQLAGTVGALSDVYKQLAGYAGETARQIDVIGAFAVNGRYSDEDAYGYGQIRDSLTGEVLAAFTNRELGTDANAAWAAYVGQMGGLIVDQLKQSDIPGWMRGEFDKLGDTITVDGLNQALQAIAAVDASFKSWSNTLAGFADLSGDVQTALLQVSGGLEGLAGNVGAFYQSFYDEAERMEILQRQVREALAGLEVGLDPSLGNEAKEGFKWAVENALAAGNGELAAQLLAMGQSFATAADYAQKSADEAIKAAEESAERVSEIMGQQNELWAMLAEAQGDHARAAQLRYDIETAGFNDAERAAYDYIASIQAQVSAAQAASASLKSLSDQQWALENQLLTLQGRTGEVAIRTREKELGELLDGVTDEDQRKRITASYDYNRSLQQQIEAMQAAQQAASAAASAQQQAADRIRNSWQSIGDSVVNEINRIRGLVVGDSGMGLDYYQAQFAIATGQARAGDEEAAKRLPEISQAMLRIAEASATSLTELQRYRNQTAGSLEETLGLLSKQFGFSVDLPKFDVGTNYVPRTMAAVIHEGEAIVPKAYNPWAGGLASGSRASNAKLEALVSQLVEENRVQAGEIARLNLRMARVLERWDIEGIPEEREG